MFSKHAGVKDSNEAEVSAILEALKICLTSCHDKVITESDSSNDISWVSSSGVTPWNFDHTLMTSNFYLHLLK